MCVFRQICFFSMWPEMKVELVLDIDDIETVYIVLHYHPGLSFQGLVKLRPM